MSPAKSTPAPAIASAAAPVGSPYAGIVGSFFDTDPNPADYSAIISWGDGTASAGIVSAAGNGEFNIFGTHPSAPDLSDPMFVSVTNVVTGNQIFAAQPAALPFTDDFAGLGLSSSWANESGSYAIVNNQAFALDLNTPNLAVLQGVSAANVTESAGVTGLLWGETAALVARYQGSGSEASFYYGGITGTGADTYSAVIYKDIGGVSTVLASTPLAPSLFGGTGTFQFEAEGSSLRLIVDNANGSPILAAQATDGSITTPGTVGIWGTAGADFTNYSASAVVPTNATISPSFTDTFDSTPDGQLRSNWTNVSGDFARNASGNLAGVNSTAPDLAVLNGVNQANVSVQADLNVPAGQYAGLVTRYCSQGMYLAEIVSSGPGYLAALYVNQGSAWTLLAPTTSVGAVGQGTLLFRSVGASLEVFWQPKGATGFSLIASATNSALTSGSVGLRAGSGATLANFTAAAVTVPTPQNAALPFSDAFANPISFANLGGSWTVQAGSVAVVNQAAVGLNSSGANIATLNGVAQNNIALRADIVVGAGAGQYAGLVARYSGAGDSDMYWGAIYRSGNGYVAAIDKNINGVWSILSSAAVPAPLTGTGTLFFDVTGSSLKLYYGPTGTTTPTLLTYAFDSSLTGASTGFRISGSTTGATSMDNFSAASLAPTSQTLPVSDSFAAAGSFNQLSPQWVEVSGAFQDKTTTGTAVGQNSATANVATIAGVNSQNVSVQANVTLNAGQYAGLVARYQGPINSDYYTAWLYQVNSTQAEVLLYRNYAGGMAQIGSSAAFASAHGVPVTLTFQAEGSSLKVFVGATLRAYAEDSFFTGGSVGIYGQAGVPISSFSASNITPTAPVLATAPATFNANLTSESTAQAMLGVSPSQLDNTQWVEQAGNFTTSAAGTIGNATVNIATLYGVNNTNVSIQASVTLKAGQYAGLVARFQGPAALGQSPNSNYYTAWLAQVNSTQAEVLIYRNSAGGMALIGSSGLFANTPGVNTLNFQAEGSSLKVFVGATLRAYAEDSVFTGGSVGIYGPAGVPISGFRASTIGAGQSLPVSDPLNTSTNPFAGQLNNANWIETAGNFAVSAGGATGRAAVNLATLIAPKQASANLALTIAFSAANQTAGLVALYSGPMDTNYYYASVTSNSTAGVVEVTLYKNINGAMTKLIAKQVSGFHGGLEFTVVGNTLTLSTDNTQQLQITDSSITTAGLVGIRTTAGVTVTNFSAS
jgi:hypothetical protein